MHALGVNLQSLFSWYRVPRNVLEKNYVQTHKFDDQLGNNKKLY